MHRMRTTWLIGRPPLFWTENQTKAQDGSKRQCTFEKRDDNPWTGTRAATRFLATSHHYCGKNRKKNWSYFFWWRSLIETETSKVKMLVVIVNSMFLSRPCFLNLVIQWLLRYHITMVIRHNPQCEQHLRRTRASAFSLPTLTRSSAVAEGPRDALCVSWNHVNCCITCENNSTPRVLDAPAVECDSLRILPRPRWKLEVTRLVNHRRRCCCSTLPNGWAANRKFCRNSRPKLSFAPLKSRKGPAKISPA